MGVEEDRKSGKGSTIGPSAPLLHQNAKGRRSIRECLGIGHILHGVSMSLFDVDLETHESILGKIFVGLGARRSLIASHILEEGVKRLSLNSFPSEETVCTWQYRSVAKERFEGLIWGVTQLVLEKLRGLRHILNEGGVRFDEDLYLTADTTCTWA